MATITENINRITQAKADIKEAIIAKGVELSDDVRIDDYAEKIGEIKQGGEVNTFGAEMVDKIGLGGKCVTKIIIDESVTKVGDSAYYYFNQVLEFVLHDKIEAFGNASFQRCEKITRIAIPKLVKLVPGSCFSGCVKLSDVICHDDIMTLGSYCFQMCGEMDSFIFPAAISMIGNNTFQSCSKLTNCDFRKATQVPTLQHANAFSTANSSCKFIVPDALYNEWVSATNWTTYADRIIKASEYTES